MLYKIKKYFQWSNIFRMIKRIVQKIKTKKNGEIREIFGRPDKEKKSRLRAFARMQAKNKKWKVNEKLIKNKSLGFEKKISSDTDTKIDVSFCSRYQNLVSVVH